jgi:hypothetical protein
MNERIRELMMQSWNTYYNQEVNGTQFPIVQKFDAEKFAELIVKECAGLVEDYYDEDTKYLAGHIIRKHFGVK